MVNYRALADHLGPRVLGWERSAKFTPSVAHTQRWLFGFDKQGLKWAELVRQPYLAGFPDEVLSSIGAQWEAANFAYCALDLEPIPTLKFYLEFPVLVSTQVGAVTLWGEPALWCRGYKVDGDQLKHSQTDYHLLPGQSVQASLVQVPRLCADPLMRRFADFLARRVSSRDQTIDILRVIHGSSAGGLDFRLYGEGLTVSDWLGDLVQNPTTPAWLQQHQMFLTHIHRQSGSAELGHVSIGVGKKGDPYMNLYWSVDAGPQWATPS